MPATRFIASLQSCFWLLFFCLISAFLNAQPLVYYSSAAFNSSQGPFIETYITFAGKSMKQVKKDKARQCSGNVTIRIYKDSLLVKAERYNIHGPLFTDSLNSPGFIDCQRYALPNGTYTIKLDIYDNNAPIKKTAQVVEELNVKFDSNEFQCSSFELLEKFTKSENPGPLVKSGFEMIPYTVNYFPESSHEITFYAELYNGNKSLGNDAPFIINYYIETAEYQPVILNSFGSFKKEKAAAVNPILGRIDITKLGTGNYNLVIVAKDQNNTKLLEKKCFFQRLNEAMDITRIQKNAVNMDISQYVGACNNTDTLKMFVECLWPIADGIDKERIINSSLTRSQDLMKKFIVDFWKRRAADTANPVKLWAQYYRQVQIAMALFKCGKQPGYYTDRGRVFLQYGAPNQRAQQTMEVNTFPYEIWHYYRTTDAATGMFFSNRKFVFANKTLGDDCYKLVHSDMRGEINNPQWQFELTRRNNNGISNPDNNTPNGTQLNQFNDIFTSPR